MSQKYCTSCASPIPDDQGNSCSMCYGDIDHGTDGFYRQWGEAQMRRESERQDEQAERERQRDEQA